jgi:hypothetical protein
MKRKIKKWLYNFSKKIIFRRIVLDDNLLTPNYLENKGWVKDGNTWTEPNVKQRDKIWIEFENHYFRCFIGKDKTFVGLESSEEWFDMFYLLLHGDNGRYDLIKK